MTIILAMERCCNEIGIGRCDLADGGTITLPAEKVAFIVDEHMRSGGVVPEIASLAAHLIVAGAWLSPLDVPRDPRPAVLTGQAR